MGQDGCAWAAACLVRGTERLGTERLGTERLGTERLGTER
jgi:hypothetical protein